MHYDYSNLSIEEKREARRQANKISELNQKIRWAKKESLYNEKEIDPIKTPYWDNVEKLNKQIRTCFYRRKINSKEYRMKNLLKYKIKSCETRSIKKKFDFNLTIDYIKELFVKQNHKCFYTNLPISETNFSIDRIDSNLGYTQDNIVLCLWNVNKMKNDLSLDRFYQLCELIVENKIKHI
jgi:hypothetical protein